MFHFFKQQKRLFLQMMLSNLDAAPSGNTEKILTHEEIHAIIESLKKLNSSLSTDVEKNYNDASKKNTEKDVLDFINTKAPEYKISKEQINTAYAEGVAKIQSETKEQLSTIEANDKLINIDFGTGRTDFAGLRKNINTPSFDSLIKNMSYDELSKFVTSIHDAKTGNKKQEGGYYYTPFNIGKLKDLFLSQGYNSNSVLFIDGIEMGTLVALTENIKTTQEKLNNTANFKEKLAVIFDYNQDGVVDNDVHFYTKEKQFFEAIKDEKQFENVLKNLGYSSKQEFDEKFRGNYFEARYDFKNRLGMVLSVKNFINPSLMKKNPNAIKEFNEMKEQIKKEVDSVVENNKRTKNLPNDIKSKIKLEAVGLVVGASVGAGASFDITGLTNNIIDSLHIGIVNGVPGIGISKNIYKTKEGKFKVDIGAINLIPFISVTGVLIQAEYEKFDALFPNKIDKKMEVSITGMTSTIGHAVMLDITKVDEETKIGIEKAKKVMSEMLDEVFNEIKEGKKFEDSKYKGKGENKAIYEAIAGLYKSMGEDALKEGTLKNYERALYENADGYKFTGVSIVLLGLIDYLPIPLLLSKGEYKRTEWKKVDTVEETSKSILPDTTSTQPPVATRSAVGVTQTTEREHLKSNYEKTDSFEEINKVLLSFESAFSYKTRFNKGSYALMNPEHDLNTRWNGLLQLSRGVKSLRNAELNSFLKTVTNESDKWIVISTISQYMKKAKDFDNGDASSWNTKTEKFINIDKKRRKAFDKMFGFSLQTETDEYYKKLQEGKGNISKTLLRGVGFDATSSANVDIDKKFVKGIDTLYTNLSILTVDGKPLLIKITDKEKINAFKEKVKSLKNISEDVKNSLITGIDNGTVELNFYKDPEGFDDRILPTILGPVTPRGAVPPPTGMIDELPSYVNVYQPEHSSIAVVGGLSGKVERKSEGAVAGPTENTTTPGATQNPTGTNTNVIDSSGPSF